ncbi:MMPL family transporter [Paractinoplanes hotanensis]|uniref:MMPL family transporter n=1 Tax=Paractinoplanes hotanensis TaxID=2906497 RepID=A0ABT0YCU4_9ACTN|nr:MMPL family transporter [Actinoplanes hotanensis]MCM4083873.1 MMPL family transporter [Actinoplanes hotanensis]
MSGAYARAVVRYRWALVVGWLLLALAAVGYQPPSRGSGLEGLISAENPAVQTELRSFERFGFPLMSRVAVVQHDPAGLSALTQAEAVARAAAVTQGQYPDAGPILGAIPVMNTAGWFPSSQQRDTTILTLLFMPPNVGPGTQMGAAHRFVERHFGPEDRVIGVTGTLPAQVQQGVVVGRSVHTTELVTLAAVLLIVAVAFRSAVAPFVTLITAGAAALLLLDVVGALGWLLQVAVPNEVAPLLIALLLGVVTDYVVFYLFAMRRALAKGLDRYEAARQATQDTTVIVTVAGLTVAAGTGVLVVARSPLFHAFGPGMALAVLVGLLAATTLVPALMAILGPYLFWPGGHRPGAASERDSLISRGRRTAWLVRPRNAAAVLVVGVGLLALASVPMRSLGLGMSFVASLPAENEVRQAAVAARQGFAAGVLSPTVVLVEGPGVTQQRDALARLQAMLADRPAVADVLGPSQQPLPDELGLVLSRDGAAARFLVILDTQPLGASGIEAVVQLRRDLPALLDAAGLVAATAGVGGDTAVAADIVSQTTADLRRIVVATVVVNLIMLILFLRALVAPLLLLALNVLGLAATLGLSTWFFTDVLGGDGLTFYVPFATAVLLVALGSDYNIFTVGQVWHEARRRPMRQALVLVTPASSRAVTTAAVILAVSFGLLHLIPLQPFREIAFTLAVGVVVDAVLIRSLLMPALLSLLGSASGWPSRRLRRAGSPPERQTRRRLTKLLMPQRGAVRRSMGGVRAPSRRGAVTFAEQVHRRVDRDHTAVIGHHGVGDDADP